MRHTNATGIAMLALLALWLSRGAPPQPEAMAVRARPDEFAVPRRNEQHAAEPSSRTVVTAPAPTGPGFDALLQQLVGLALRGHEEIARAATAPAEATDAEAFALFQRIRATVADVDDRALWALTALGAGDDLPTRVTRTLLGRFLDSALQRRQQAAAGARAGLVAYVDALLGLLVPERANAELVAALLTDQPYLGVEHEDALLQLTELAAHHPYLSGLVRPLLRTLWTNLQTSGTRSSGELQALAMLFKSDPNPTRRAAALETLLTAKDPRLVELVMAEVASSNDQASAIALAQVAAERLEAEHALVVMRRLAPVAGHRMTGPALTLGSRDAGAVRRCYEQLLGDGREPRLRADLVTGMGFNPGRDNLDLVEAAFELDPDVEVRQRALLALTGASGVAHGEPAVRAALANPTFTAHPAGLDVIVTALDNLARGGQMEAVGRLAPQIASRSDVGESTLGRLRALLAKTRPVELR